MVSEKFYLRLLTFVALLTVLALSGHFFLSFFLVGTCTLHLTVFLFFVFVLKFLLKCACSFRFNLELKCKRWESSVNVMWADHFFSLCHFFHFTAC